MKIQRQKGFVAIIILIFVIIAVVAYFGYKYVKSNNLSSEQSAVSTQAPTIKPSSSPISKMGAIKEINGTNNGSSEITLNGNKYYVSKVGDKVGLFDVSDIQHLPGNAVSITFKGNVQVTGNYYKYDDNGEGMETLFNNMVCMSGFDSASLSVLPKLVSADKDISFCFDNSDYAQKILAKYPTSGKMTFTIDSYTVTDFATEAVDGATLKSVAKIY